MDENRKGEILVQVEADLKSDFYYTKRRNMQFVLAKLEDSVEAALKGEI